MARPSFGRALSLRGFDLFDTPPVALDPIFAREPLLAGIVEIAEPFCGRGNLVGAMRERGIFVHASDIFDRNCPDSTTPLDFFDMRAAPAVCWSAIRLTAKQRRRSSTLSRSASRRSSFCCRRDICTRPIAASASTSAAVSLASTSWIRGFKTCTTRPTFALAARPRANPKCTAGLCLIRAISGRRPFIPRRCTIPTSLCRGKSRPCCAWSNRIDRLWASSVSRLPSRPPTSGRVSTGSPGPPETMRSARQRARSVPGCPIARPPRS